ncbi:hypothetical protein [Micromonospora sp. IBHARD004]|uniref:hypothetical protein n=1 Tax=Micromonospora sp. IBHARD004 TaxID=3457764 RepID=UPI004059DE1A
MRSLLVDILTSAPMIVALATLAVSSLFYDLVRREVVLKAPSPRSTARSSRWRWVKHSLTRWCRTCGIVATVLFSALVALRFIALGA